MIADYEGDITKLFEGNEDGELPLLATRNLVLFPGVVSPVLIGRTSSLNLINYLKETPEQAFAVFCQKNADEDNPSKKEQLFEALVIEQGYAVSTNQTFFGLDDANYVSYFTFSTCFTR